MSDFFIFPLPSACSRYRCPLGITVLELFRSEHSPVCCWRLRRCLISFRWHCSMFFFSLAKNQLWIFELIPIKPLILADSTVSMFLSYYGTFPTTFFYKHQRRQIKHAFRSSNSHTLGIHLATFALFLQFSHGRVF